jgi:hypothetical protein
MKNPKIAGLRIAILNRDIRHEKDIHNHLTAEILTQKRKYSSGNYVHVSSGSFSECAMLWYLK